MPGSRDGSWLALLADLEPHLGGPVADAAADRVAPADVAAPVPAGRAADAEVRPDGLAGHPHPPLGVPVVGAAAGGRVVVDRVVAGRGPGLCR